MYTSENVLKSNNTG